MTFIHLRWWTITLFTNKRENLFDLSYALSKNITLKDIGKDYNYNTLKFLSPIDSAYDLEDHLINNGTIVSPLSYDCKHASTLNQLGNRNEFILSFNSFNVNNYIARFQTPRFLKNKILKERMIIDRLQWKYIKKFQEVIYMLWPDDISFEGFSKKIDDWYDGKDFEIYDPPIKAQYALDLIFKTLIDDKENYPYLTTNPESTEQTNSL